jgi:hypothetical protein
VPTEWDCGIGSRRFPPRAYQFELGSSRGADVRILTWTGVECYVLISTPSLRVLTLVC